MDRLDGKNPFDPETYIKPAAIIQTMIELRAFCADFFEKHIRTSVGTDEEDIAAFVALITHSPNIFARARAVIPEFQAPDLESSYPNEKVRVFLDATRDVRGSLGKECECLPEESAWTKLIKDGMDMAILGLGHMKHLSDASARDSPMVPAVLAPGKAEYKHPSSNPKPLPKKLDLTDIPTFVPQHAMGSEKLVWSPTSGTRLRRPDEFYQDSTKVSPANPMQSGQEIAPNASSAYNIKNQYLFHGSRDLSDTPTKSHLHSDSLRLTPPPEFKSTQSPLNPSAALSSRSKENSHHRRMRRNNLDETPFPDSVDQMMEMVRLSDDPSSRYPPSSHFDTTAYPISDLSRTNSPSQFKGPRYPSNQARGVYGAEPFSAPPSVPGYGNLHQTGQSLYGGPPSPFQNQLGPFQTRPNAVSSHPFDSQVPYAANPDIWAAHPSRQRHGAFSNQLPSQIIHPIPQTIPQAQQPPWLAQAPPISETLSVPPQGSMTPLEHWNLLYQRENEICTRLQNANRPMTDEVSRYISMLREACVNAVATNIPARSGMSKGKWVAKLNQTLRSIWKTGPGGTGFPLVVVARKMDFEKALEREIGRASGVHRHDNFGSALDRAYVDRAFGA